MGHELTGRKLDSVLVIAREKNTAMAYKHMVQQAGIANNVVIHLSGMDALAYLERQLLYGTFPELILVEMGEAGYDGIKLAEAFYAYHFSELTDSLLVLLADSLESLKLKQIAEAPVEYVVYLPLTLEELWQLRDICLVKKSVKAVNSIGKLTYN